MNDKNILHTIPDFNNFPLLLPLIGDNKNEEYYLEKITKFEIECEKYLQNIFSVLSINSTVKTDRYSLPYKDEIIISASGESYLNGAYEFRSVLRKIVKQILNKNIYSLRFYIFIEIKKTRLMGKIDYHFRYWYKK